MSAKSKKANIFSILNFCHFHLWLAVSLHQLKLIQKAETVMINECLFSHLIMHALT